MRVGSPCATICFRARTLRNVASWLSTASAFGLRPRKNDVRRIQSTVDVSQARSARSQKSATGGFSEERIDANSSLGRLSSRASPPPRGTTTSVG